MTGDLHFTVYEHLQDFDSGSADRCCFDYGNAEADGFAGAPGTMEAIYVGNDSQWWRERPTADHQRGPFIMADFEDGMFAGDDYIDPNAVPSWHGMPYVTAMLKGHTCQFSLKGGSAAPSGGLLTTLYDGVRPQHYDYSPMYDTSISLLRPPSRLSVLVGVVSWRVCMCMC
eukprot:COSAG05_NODE_2675_length_2779_cov_1.849254_3_plen_171_part_00